jgi:hypothetical protein
MSIESSPPAGDLAWPSGIERRSSYVIAVKDGIKPRFDRVRIPLASAGDGGDDATGRRPAPSSS